MTYKLLIGDCLDTLRDLPDESVNTCVTSPPYFGLRDYGVEGQLGAEPTPDEFVDALVRVFREVRRVLRDDGTVWLNLGDSYQTTSGGGQQVGQTNTGAGLAPRRATSKQTGLKGKDLIGIPWRVAFALQKDGWYLRQDIIWHKPNPMPESVRDRCTKAHEYVFLLSKSPKYYYDHEAAKEPATSSHAAGNKRHKYADQYEREKGVTQQHRTKAGLTALAGVEWETRNRRTVWTVGAKPYRGAHFATFPPDLIQPCVLAGCPEGGTVLDPFGGSGTTAGVALAHNRKAILCELNPEYAALVPDRVQWVMDYYGFDPDREEQMDIFCCDAQA